MSRRSQPTASGRGCSSAWATSSPSPVSLGTAWRAQHESPASGGDGVCGVRLCQGVLVGGHVLSFCLAGCTVLELLAGQGSAWRYRRETSGPGGAMVGRGSWDELQPCNCMWGRGRVGGRAAARSRVGTHSAWWFGVLRSPVLWTSG